VVVIDLTNMNIAAEIHGKVDPDLLAEQIHFTGRWFNTARVAIEMGGGYGEPVVISLRDGKRGRRPYPKLYRHVQMIARTTSRTSPTVPDHVEDEAADHQRAGVAIREEAIPMIPMDTILECKTFVRRDTLPPRADGRTTIESCRLRGAEMYRRYGSHPLDVRTSRKKKREYQPDYAWS
jgi:hypothetical protein